MSWLEQYDHPALGLLKPEGDGGWRGRSGSHADFFDIFLMHDGGAAEAPSPSAVAALDRALREIAYLKSKGVRAICTARQTRLNWRDGPSVDGWSMIELRVEADGGIWLTLSDDSDEYSRWLVRLEEQSLVRRIPALAIVGHPSAAGVAV